MAEYKYIDYLYKVDNAAFDTQYAAGMDVANGGIYRCNVCMDEVLVPARGLLPDETKHPHRVKVTWKLIVRAQ